MKHIIYCTISMLVAAFLLLSCEKEAEMIELTSDLNGEWEVMAYLEDAPIHDGTFPLIITSSFPVKTDSITIRDTSKSFWNFQIKVAANHENGTFETEKSICEICDFGIGIKVLNGKVIDSDSICMEIQFEDDETPYGNTYLLKGHRKVEVADNN
ncbi:lipid-binding protein [Petrimonas mucosa]|jgi:hypothetical protein|uniref:Lipid-binding putative hydrolase n=2 Tax=Dysgonomonadaceae TaxID=2005520 RepID=A0A1G4G8J3_9BACT|nr:lipid-binding protein [Petrimonas mucosa]SCM58840.1 Lipid-binding putative hydrolase [Petrimonas mucosa]SFU27370.1 Lipid-binding putative hydrolase [Porphyromonadaceae bacterium KHP3R9]